MSQMMVDRATLEQALEALEAVDGPITALLGGLLGSPDTDAPGAKVRAAITALRAALAQQPEPSGYCTLEQLVVMQRTVPSPDKIAIYTAPPKADQLIRMADAVRPSGYWDQEDLVRFGWQAYRAGAEDGARQARARCALEVEQAGVDGLGTLAAAALIRQRGAA